MQAAPEKTLDPAVEAAPPPEPSTKAVEQPVAGAEQQGARAEQLTPDQAQAAADALSSILKWSEGHTNSEILTKFVGKINEFMMAKGIVLPTNLTKKAGNMSGTEISAALGPIIAQQEGQELINQLAVVIEAAEFAADDANNGDKNSKKPAGTAFSGGGFGTNATNIGGIASNESTGGRGSSSLDAKGAPILEAIPGVADNIQ